MFSHCNLSRKRAAIIFSENLKRDREHSNLLLNHNLNWTNSSVVFVFCHNLFIWSIFKGKSWAWELRYVDEHNVLIFNWIPRFSENLFSNNWIHFRKWVHFFFIFHVCAFWSDDDHKFDGIYNSLFTHFTSRQVIFKAIN